MLKGLTIKSAHDGLIRGDFSSVELTKECYKEIKNKDEKIHAFLNLTEDMAMAQAKEADKKLKEKKDLSPLLGVPIAVKDNITVKGEKTTAGSKILENYVAPYDATVIERLKKSGAVILGKTNLDEFGHGASTENSAFGPTHNPHDLERVPGGSSGGSAAAVAGEMCVGAVGSDTGGSIRYPAGFCGVVGLKPTYGRVSRYGLLSMTSSTDTIGPITKTVEDAAMILSEIAGQDPRDSTTGSQPLEDYLKEMAEEKELIIGIPKEFFGAGLDPAIDKIIKDLVRKLEDAGFKIKEVSLPHSQYSIAVYYILTPSEISANLARYDGQRFGFSDKKANNLFESYALSRGNGFGAEAKRRIMLGTYALSAGYYDAYYLQAQKVRTVISQEIKNVFRSVDVILTPTAPHIAFKLGEKVDDPLAMYLEDVYMSLASITGLPAMSVPVGKINDLPVGAQLFSWHFKEGDILNIGNRIETMVKKIAK